MRHAGGKPPAVVVAMSYSGLALARSLGRRGIGVYAVAASRHEVGMSSRFVTPVIYPNLVRSDQETVDALLDLARQIGEPAVLFPTGDALVLPLSRQRQQLGEHYRFLIPDPDVVERLVSKQGLSEVIRERGIPGPFSTTMMEPGELDGVESDLQYPAIMKPVYSASWYRPEMVRQIGNRKVVVVENREELRHWYGLIASVDPRVVLQEFVPGEDSQLHYVCGYFNANGKLEAVFAGQKLRVQPIHFGSASFVRSVRDDRLVQAARDLLQPLSYKGLFGVEFKLDSRDNLHKVIEVNVRWGLWDGLARRCGIDLAYLAYAREAELPFEVGSEYRTGVNWLCARRDLDAFLDYRKEKSLSAWEWLKSLIGETEHATFAWDDPLPGIVEASATARQKFKGLWSRVARPKP